MPFQPDEFSSLSQPFLDAVSDDKTAAQHDAPAAAAAWVPMLSHGCTFGPDIFTRVMMNLIRNPNINSAWLFRADILHDDGEEGVRTLNHVDQPIIHHRQLGNMTRRRTLVRRLVPRSEKRDKPLNQTCSFYSSTASGKGSLRTARCVVYLPHASVDELPFYHPPVDGIAHHHDWDPAAGRGTISVHFLVAQPEQARQDPKLRRISFHMLQVLHRHGEGTASGYTKRVQHDVVVPQARFQDRYAALKTKHARRLVNSWVESTDPAKHVFEDLAIAAFLIELWADMYADGTFPGFVDIGCGNGLLVHLLTQEGYPGWGFDARARKSWASYCHQSSLSSSLPSASSSSPSCSSPSPSSSSSSPSSSPLLLQEKLLLPDLARQITRDTTIDDNACMSVHNGVFPPGTFIISNHADELTPWTPILGHISQCPFVMIPCCSHNLAGARFRAPAPKDKTKSSSTYSSLVDWVARIAQDCGWVTETEMLRIPSTRNTCILGRTRASNHVDVDVATVVAKYGGADGFCDNVVKLLKTGPRTH
ncbi:tRNA (uracil-O(2)-)-methyltransferase [Moelleriella libera RCEF 2490]|uniref:tRNA (uracil-O(2)-)-methyltransferase n=1 Tax=Moelleriella libera RCEF 2490 TaxID=1081109 RepID=A0A168FB38_9HYPO|nr:tRNA (uracil-O(2)-)-methyltransferase [Moelleriella libera RCEF 2490]